MHEYQAAAARHEGTLRHAGAHRLAEEIGRQARLFSVAHEVDLEAIRHEHLAPRMRAVHLMAVFVWFGVAVMIASELARYSAGGHTSWLGVRGACASAALAVVIVILLGPRPLCKTRRTPLLCATGATFLIAAIATQGTSADWAPQWYLGAGLVLMLCSIILTVVRFRNTERVAIIDRDLVRINKGLRRDLEAELDKVPALSDDGAPLDADAERARAELVAAMVALTAPKTPGSDWKPGSPQRAEEAAQASRRT